MLSCFSSFSHYPKPSDGALMKQIGWRGRRFIIHGPDELQKVWVYREARKSRLFPWSLEVYLAIETGASSQPCPLLDLEGKRGAEVTH